MPVRFRRKTQLLLAALLGVACATPPPAPAALADAPPGERAFLWEVQSAQQNGGLMFLVGSIHVAQGGAQSLPPAMKKAFVLSDELVVEVDVTAVDAAKLRQFILEHGLLPEGQRLSEQLEPETAKLLADTAERLGTPMEGWEHMRPWVVAMTLPALASRGASAAPGPGVDLLFLANAQGTKPIVELETADAQLQVFAGLPEPVQERMLRDHLLHLGELPGELERLEAAWKAGDAEALEAEVFQREREDPELRPLYEKLFYERNVRMAGKLGEMLARPRVYCVVVGAGHVVGPRGLVALLRKQGHRVRQLPRD
jgi:uncharacterized protein YbaP (TraB family)